MAATIDPRTEVGRVALTVRDGARVGEFYERVVGLEPLAADGRLRVLGAGGRALVELHEDPGAPPRPARAAGLFHLALLVPDRAELARSLRRLVAARWPLQGASDHLVSEALYLADPEGNGIEVYRDRPRADWRRDGDEVAMATLPLDVDALLAEAPGVADGTVAPATRMGHVHLDVSDLGAAERFYARALGLDVTARGYPGALFLAAGGYHHHIGTNVWRRASCMPADGNAGLRWFELVLPGPSALDAVAERARAGGWEAVEDGATVAARDPDGLLLRLSTAV